MQEKRWYPDKAVVDINVLAIYLVEDHPGYPYVSTYIDELLKRRVTLYTHSLAPFRVLWILTRIWRIDEGEAVEAVRSLVEALPIVYVGLSREWILKSFELAEELGHDVYDCSYLALALMTGAEAIISTDRDFEHLAPRAGLRYVNPVPLHILQQFYAYRRGGYSASRVCP